MDSRMNLFNSPPYYRESFFTAVMSKKVDVVSKCLKEVAVIFQSREYDSP